MSHERRLSDIRNIVSGVYTLGETIGTGHYAVVKLARHVFTQKEVAVKVIDKTKLDDVSKAHLFQEVMCMKSVQHPNVVRLYEVIDTPNKLYLILEFGDGGDMYDYIMKHVNGLNEPLARIYFRQICQALKFCHQMHVCHRDLKPENLVFFEKQGVVKLTDFGFSNQFSPGQKLLTSCGSLAYSAPEILLGDPYDAPAVDIWSLGVILFMLVTGHAPFQEANDSETVMMILDCCYKLPPNVSIECQNLIHRMIVRDPEKRATLDEIMSDIWYRQCEFIDDDFYEDEFVTDSLKLITDEEHEFILNQMAEGNIAERETIIEALKEDQYNHITATYYLLTEKVLHDKIENDDRNVKQRRSLQPANDRFTEQIGIFISPLLNFHFADVSLPITRRNSNDENSDTSSVKENIPPLLPSPRHSLDLSNESSLSALIEDDEKTLSIQQRTSNSTQAMKIILEEDENSESSTEKTDIPIQQLGNSTKLNKIIENDEDDSTTNNVLRLKDLRSAVENKRRNFSRSYSSSDSEDNGSFLETNRLSNNKISVDLDATPSNHRGRSFSNIENVFNETPSNIQQQQILNDVIRRKSTSRANSIISANRLILLNLNDEFNNETTGSNNLTLGNDRTRSLSNEHRLANPSQMSIASRTSIRFSTPRESTVFTKNEAPMVIRLLQQASHQDKIDAVRTIIEHQRLSTHQEHKPTPIIVEEDLSTSNTNINSFKNNSEIQSEEKNLIQTPIVNGHVSTLTTLKNSLVKHQQQRKSTNQKDKQKHLLTKNRACCTIF